ncbi:ribosomal protein ymL32-like protein [Pestalotiopsis sp. NC0098]|nr:ribosomal protein ymL32-like protein [Pestalotiopsis sp. NC0098]
MAAIQQLRMGSAISSMLPRLSATNFAASFRSTLLFSQQSRQSPSLSWPSLAIAVPAALQSIPGILGDIWEGILKAVPKKKTSHMKKRHRLLAGKALKDVTALNKCPACGHTKKMHTICPQCMGKIQGMFPNTSKPAEETGAAA